MLNIRISCISECENSPPEESGIQKNNAAAKKNGFTLVELLVVIAIVGILVSLTMPAMRRAREAARRSSCTNNLQQISIAAHNYLSAHRTLPSGWIRNPTEFRCYVIPLEEPLYFDSPEASGVDEESAWLMYQWWGWPALILSQMEQTTLMIDFEQPEKHSPYDNRRLIRGRIENYVCPSSPLPPRSSEIPGYLSYRGNVGYWPPDSTPLFNGLFHGNSSIDDKDIVDGLSQTVMFGESQAGLFWADAFPVAQVKDEFGDPTFDRYVEKEIDPFDNYLRLSGAQCPAVVKVIDVFSYGSHHNDVINFAYADGSVHTLSKTLDGDVFRMMWTRAGREAF